MSALSTVIGKGTFAARPAAGNTGRLYFATDGSGTLYRDNGSSWDTVTSAASGVPAGTSFPGSPATNDLYFRTDRGLLYFYDGTRWLTLTLYDMPIGVSGEATLPLSASVSSAWRSATFNDVYDLYLVDWHAMSFVNTTNTSGAFWTLTLRKETKAAAYATADIASFTTGTGPDTVGQWTVHTVALNVLLGTAHGTVLVAPTKTSTPGTMLFHSNLTYRLVG